MKDHVAEASFLKSRRPIFGLAIWAGEIASADGTTAITHLSDAPRPEKFIYSAAKHPRA